MHKITFSILTLFVLFTINSFGQTKKIKIDYNVQLLDEENLFQNHKGLRDLFEEALSMDEYLKFCLFIENDKVAFVLNKQLLDFNKIKFNPSILTFFKYNGMIYNVKDSIYENFPVLGKNIYKKSPKISHWVLHQESKYIGSYLCYKATNTNVVDNGNGKIFNHPVIAWFCPEIPLQFGPIGYGNLPGLIIELQVRNVVYGVSHIDYNPINFFDFSEFNKIKIYNETQINEMFENGLD